MTQFAIPVSAEKQRYMELEEMEVGDILQIDRDDQQKYSDTAGIFHKATTRVYRTSRRNQPEGKAIVWRVK